MMKYNVFKELEKIINNIEDKFIEIIRGKDKSSFIRHRKVSPKLIFLFLLAFKGKSLKNELETFFGDISKPKDVSTWGFTKQRMKFNPEAIKAMNNEFIKHYYENRVNIKRLNGYIVLAGDGSDIIVPSTEENKLIFGYIKGDKVSPAMGKVSVIYDCINKVILDIQLNTYKYSEIDLVYEHLKTVRDILEDQKIILIFDRGYPNIKLIINLLDGGEKFLFRLKSTDFKREQQLMKSNDEWVDICFNRARLNQYRRDFYFCERLLMMKKLSLRFVKIPIKTANGEMIEEVLLTNLSTEEFNTADLKKLYHQRWEIESSYRVLKSNQKLEEFSGAKPLLIQQDIFISAFAFNIIQILTSQLTDKIPIGKYKYEMKINTNFTTD